MTVWFTSDPHLGHQKVAGLRGFETPDDMGEVFADNWTSVVRKGHQVWILGDLSMRDPDLALQVIAKLPGTKHFISGNHDPCHPMHRQSHQWQRLYFQAFDSVQPFARRRIRGQDVLLSHFPYSKDRHEARYMQYRLRDEGAWLLHGHTHGKERREGREIHVGLDAWDMQLVSIDTISKLMTEEDS